MTLTMPLVLGHELSIAGECLQRTEHLYSFEGRSLIGVVNVAN
jgi:hypothetical protein